LGDVFRKRLHAQTARVGRLEQGGAARLVAGSVTMGAFSWEVGHNFKYQQKIAGRGCSHGTSSTSKGLLGEAAVTEVAIASEEVPTNDCWARLQSREDGYSFKKKTRAPLGKDPRSTSRKTGGRDAREEEKAKRL